MVFEEQTEAADYGALRAFRQAHGEVGLSGKPFVEAGQQRRASGQDHSAVVNVAGGLGRPYATLGGALIVGLAIQIAGTYTSSAYELVFAFLLLVLLMLFRPNGVFVRRSSVTVRA